MDNVFIPLDKNAAIRRRRRYLPHWEQPGCTYFVTFRLADSLPKAKRLMLEEERSEWMRHHPKPWDERERKQYYRRFTERVQEWLDQGAGACVLEHPEIGQIVADALLHFDEERYVLDRYVVMPNHVHLLAKPDDKYDISSLMHSWCSYTANEINSALGQSGQLWMPEDFDHAVRSWQQLLYFRRYIEDNPRKAGLEPGQYILGMGSGLRPPDTK